jgi:hypothetical protein
MCKECDNNNNQPLYEQKEYRLADYFNQWWDIYAKSPSKPISQEQYKAVNALRVCRTPALGVDVYACPDCGEISEVYHSCKNRFCPTCSWHDTVKWAEKVKSKMMNLPHRHIVMTLPHQLNGLIKRNGKSLLNILMRTAADTFKDWMEAKYKLKPGIISVLHTFGETKDYHVHTHMIVSWGGIENDTHLLKPIKGEFVKYDFLKDKFRNKFEDELVKLYDNNELIHNFNNKTDLNRFLKRINDKKWIIHLEKPMDIPEKVVRYIGRYSKRTCLSEYKITKMEGKKIAFRYKDNKCKDKNGKPIEMEMELEYTDFFPRLLQHVPLKYFRLVRYYGFYSNKSNIPEEYLSKSDNANNEIITTELDIDDNQVNNDEKICQYCNKKKVYQHTFFIKRDGKKFKIFRIQMIMNNKNKYKESAA